MFSVGKFGWKNLVFLFSLMLLRAVLDNFSIEIKICWLCLIYLVLPIAFHTSQAYISICVRELLVVM